MKRNEKIVKMIKKNFFLKIGKKNEKKKSTDEKKEKNEKKKKNNKSEKRKNWEC